MAKFLTTSGTADHLEQIVTDAQERLMLVSPYLQIPPILLQRLYDAERRGVHIRLVYGKKDLRKEQRQQLMGLRNLHIYYLENLHAKCYMNEGTAIITSMNLYEYSEKTNREMGILLTSTEPAYADAQREVDSIIAAAVCERGAESAPTVRSLLGTVASSLITAVQGSAQEKGAQHGARSYRPVANPKTGACIRCLTEISRNPARPLCRSCYEIWASFGNPDYPENGCHHCGKPGDVSLARPLCRSCYRATQQAR